MAHQISRSSGYYVTLHPRMTPDEHATLRAVAKAQDRSIAYIAGRELAKYAKEQAAALGITPEVPGQR